MANNPITSLFSGITSFSSRNDTAGVDEIKDRIQSARVVDISLNSNSAMWSEVGEWGAIGTIKFQLIGTPTKQDNSTRDTVTNYAKPLLPNIKNYPLINEIVLLFKLPNTNASQATTKASYYYLNPISLWNAPNCNPYPDIYSDNSGATSPSNNKSYAEIEAGNVNRTTQQVTPIDLNGLSGGTFEEQSNIHPVLPFAGDVIVEGRFGNSIRLGNTSKVAGEVKNNWSNSGKDGSPISIIRNGQPEDVSDEGWIPITEDVNKDLASMYLTSTQQIPIEVAVSVNKDKIEGEGSTIPFSNTIKKTPISPKAYNAPQVILNSGRLLFNTTADNILFSSKKSIVLESIEDLAIKSQAKNTNILAPNGIVSLGKQNASESVILGDKFLLQFEAILQTLDNLCVALKDEPQVPAAGAVARMSIDVIRPIKDMINSFKSQRVKTS